MGRTIRALVSKIGLDGHDRGAKVVAHALRDAGYEVIYLGVRQTPLGVVNTAEQEDVDVIGLSILSGAHMTLVPLVMKELKAREMNDILVLVGGVIPDDDIPRLKEIGVYGVFTSGTHIDQVVEAVNAGIRKI